MDKINMKIKYPRTYHLPFSLGATNDDKILKDISHFNNKNIVVTEKLDGENTTMYHDYIHARSLDSKNHISRNWIKNLHAQIKHNIPVGWRICGENLFAQHSIFYDKLESYFYVFSIWDENNVCLSWQDTVEFCELLGLKHVPVLYEGIFNLDEINKCYTGVSQLGDVQEGYVIRIANVFLYEDFSKSVAKFVRKNHVETNTHWMHNEITINQIKKG